MKLPIIYEGDARLQTPSEPVEAITKKIQKLVLDMFETMYAAKGLGLAAVQVGVNKRLFVADLQRRGEKKHVLINPVIVERSGEQTTEEGCLSCPQLFGKVSRAMKVRVEAMGLDGKHVSLEAEGLLATVFQHETDHLDGILFLDRLEPAERARVERKRAESHQM